MADFRAAYRLQMTPDFSFRAARAVVPYLRELGASHLYLSPSLQARHGSTHGYDVVDPTRISEDLGGEAEFRALCETAREAGLGVVLDIVPNHMAASDEENPFWRDPDLRAKLFDDPAGEGPLTDLYAELTGDRRSFAEVAAEAKLEVAHATFSQEFDRLRALYPHEALEESAASLHVYRTYVEPETGVVTDDDR